MLLCFQAPVQGPAVAMTRMDIPRNIIFFRATVNCRDECGACCIAPSISSPIPGMPQGKPAGVRCVQLDERNRCRIFGQPERPAVCGGLQPSFEMCGTTREHALCWIGELESLTTP